MRGRVRVRTAATAATANTVAAHIWNPHTTIRCRLYELSWFKTVGTADFMVLWRTTARGTATTTVTPTIDNETDAAFAPPSGLLIDTAWTTAPTVTTAAPPLFGMPMPAAVASGFMLPLGEEMEIPPGRGLAIATPVATILQPADLNIAWAE